MRDRPTEIDPNESSADPRDLGLSFAAKTQRGTARSPVSILLLTVSLMFLLLCGFANRYKPGKKKKTKKGDAEKLKTAQTCKYLVLSNQYL